MRAYIRSAATALIIACLAATLAIVAADGALAQSKSAPAQAAPPQGQPPALKQIALTDKQVEGVVSKAKPRRWLRGFLVVSLVCAPLEHDPEKWAPVFRKDHAQTIN